jgi:tRNA pseudouridine38-40 synthase
MNAAAALLVGEHDYTSFCRRPKLPPDASLVRRVTEATWTAVDDECTFEIEANAFCHQMVRAVVGLLVTVGSGRRSPADVGTALAARDRTVVRADLAPPSGLSLVAVRYGG